MRTIVWFRNDLRLHDHPALVEAAQLGEVLPLFILPEQDQPTAFDWWLAESLDELHHRLVNYGCELVLLKGDPTTILPELARRTGADALFFNGQIDPYSRHIETTLLQDTQLDSIRIKRFEPNMLLSPELLKTQFGQPYKVFGAFWKALQLQNIPWPLPTPETITSWKPSEDIVSVKLEESGLRSSIGWDKNFKKIWHPGEQGGFNSWELFSSRSLGLYERLRDYPSIDGTSRLSGFLASGNMSIRALWHAVKRAEEEGQTAQADSYLRQLAWREFAYYQLYHFPRITEQPLRTEFNSFPWQHNEKEINAWKKGQTGYPLVDAGMRELWQTGTIHNRVRMVVASFLVKHLLVDWRIGAAWFSKTLVDYDVANNTLGWQWVAGSGFDAAPYFRIFNPTTQSKKFDAKGEYIRKWIPELSDLSDKTIHEPHIASVDELAAANIRLGETYPYPIVDHSTARKRALAAYDTIKGKRETK